MKSMIVYWSDGKWYASDVQWKRSGSGTYRETSPIAVPQTQQEIKKFAEENGYSVEWRPPLPPDVPAAAAG